MFGDVAKNAGVAAVHEAHEALDGAIPEVEKAGAALLEQLHVAIVEASGSLERAAGAVCLAAGALPGQIAEALDGLTITTTIAKRK